MTLSIIFRANTFDHFSTYYPTASFRSKILGVDLGVDPKIKIWKETEAEPAWSDYTTDGGGQYTLAIPAPDAESITGWWRAKLLIDGEEVTLLRFFLEYNSGMTYYFILQPSDMHVPGVRIGFYNLLEEVDDVDVYELSLDGAIFDNDNTDDYYWPDFKSAELRLDPETTLNNLTLYTRKNGEDLPVAIADLNWNLIPDDEGGGPPDADPEPEENVVLFSNIWFSRNPITFTGLAHPGWQAETNVNVRDDVRVQEDGDYVSTIQIDLPPDADGYVTFQVREAFRNMLKALPPAVNSAAIVELADRIKNFKHFTATLVEDEVEPSEAYEESDAHRVILGGLSKFAFKTLNFFYDYLPETRKFLTWAPDEKPVDRNQEDYLNYFNFNVLTTQIKLNLQAFFDDGTAERKEITTIPAVGGGLYEIPAGPSNSGALSVNPSKNLVKYRLYLTNQNNKLISEFRTYVVDLISSPTKRVLMFLNSFGAYEVIRFTGQAQSSVTIEKDVIVKVLQFDYQALDGEYETNYSVLRNTTNHSTGFLPSREWLDYMKDVLTSKRVFDVTEGTRKPVLIDGGTFEMGADQNYERFVRFNVIDAYEDESYTPV